MATTPGLSWAVKDSLIAYVEALDDGVVEALAPAARTDAGFTFPWAPETTAADGDPAAVVDPTAEADPSADGGVVAYRFLGAVRLAGHWGALDVELRDPRIELDGTRGVLLVRERGGRGERWLPFADLALAEPADTGTLEATTALTGHGRLLLDGQYAVGTALSPLRITLPTPVGEVRRG